MGIFERNPKDSRTIDDILTPKDEKERQEVAEDGVDQLETDTNNDTKENNKESQFETATEASFNALTCFGWSESKTSKWLIKCAHFWYGAMSFFWFVFGALTFAPIIFMQKKVDVVIKGKFKSLIFATCIYIGFLALIITLITARMR